MYQVVLAVALLFVFSPSARGISLMDMLTLSNQQQDDLEKIQGQIDGLNRLKYDNEQKLQDLRNSEKCGPIIDPNEISNCQAKVRIASDRINNLDADGKKILSELETKEAEYKNKLNSSREKVTSDKAAADKKEQEDKAAKEAKAKEKEKVDKLDKDLKLEFAKVGMSAQSLVLTATDQKLALSKFEKNIDQTRMALYLQIKMREMLQDNSMCDVVKQCEKGPKATLPPEALRRVFSSINEEGKPYSGPPPAPVAAVPQEASQPAKGKGSKGRR